VLKSGTMKRTAFTLAVFACCAGLSLGLSACDQAGGSPRIGVALFSVDNSFVSTVRRSLEAEAKGKARLSILDGQNQQSIQNAQIDALLADKAKAIIINPVDGSTIGSLVFRAKAAGVPVVFFSRDTSTVSINSWDKAFFVGVKSEEADALQVEILAEYWKDNPDADKNQDLRMQYVLLRGETNKLTAQSSEENREKAFEAAGIRTIKLAEASVNWTRVDAQKKMAEIIKIFNPKFIEAVICGNDEIALGAIEALKVAGFISGKGGFLPVVGVDGTRVAIDAIGDGSLLGTVRSDAESQGKAVFDLAYALAKELNPAAMGWNLTDGKFVLVPYRKVTKDNYKNFLD
jgi:methyl-galactoside transport system substrate-binding protein